MLCREVVFENDDFMELETHSDSFQTGHGTTEIQCSSTGNFDTTNGFEKEGTSATSDFVEERDMPKRKRKKITKTGDDHIPVPHPFPLPKHYRADVEEALRKKEMTSETKKSFLSSASAMLTYKRYPTREDYINVGRAVIEKYDFMAQPTGTPYVRHIYMTCTL